MRVTTWSFSHFMLLSRVTLNVTFLSLTGFFLCDMIADAGLGPFSLRTEARMYNAVRVETHKGKVVSYNIYTNSGWTYISNRLANYHATLGFDPEFSLLAKDTDLDGAIQACFQEAQSLGCALRGAVNYATMFHPLFSIYGLVWSAARIQQIGDRRGKTALL